MLYLNSKKRVAGFPEGTCFDLNGSFVDRELVQPYSNQLDLTTSDISGLAIRLASTKMAAWTSPEYILGKGAFSIQALIKIAPGENAIIYDSREAGWSQSGFEISVSRSSTTVGVMITTADAMIHNQSVSYSSGGNGWYAVQFGRNTSGVGQFSILIGKYLPNGDIVWSAGSSNNGPNYSFGYSKIAISRALVTSYNTSGSPLLRRLRILKRYTTEFLA